MKSIFDFQNPWRNAGYEFPDESYIQRDMFTALIEHLSKKEITALVGSRQVGKTFLIKKIIGRLLTADAICPSQIFYFNFDVLSLVALFQNQVDFLEFINFYGHPDKINYIFLDEFQRISNGGLLLKSYYELDLKIKFIISGSSTLEIKSQIKESLTGRKRLFELFPVSFSEFVSYRGVNIQQPLNLKIKFESEKYQKLLEEFVRFGGYPGVVKQKTEEEKIAQLQEIYDSYIQKDISDFLKIENLVGFNRLIQLLATQTANLCKINELSKMTGLSRYYTELFLQNLQDTYIVGLLRPYFKNLGKSIVKMPKLYFLDSGLRNVVFNQFNRLDMRTDTGQLIENFVYSELIKTVKKNQLWLYRTLKGSEVDFLYQKGENIIPIEVKFAGAQKIATPKIFSTLNSFFDINQAYVLTKSLYQERKTEHFTVHFQPVWATEELHKSLLTF